MRLTYSTDHRCTRPMDGDDAQLLLNALDEYGDAIESHIRTLIDNDHPEDGNRVQHLRRKWNHAQELIARVGNIAEDGPIPCAHCAVPNSLGSDGRDWREERESGAL